MIEKKLLTTLVTLAMLSSIVAVVGQVTAEDSTPSITFTYNNMQKRVTIVSADPGYHYSDSISTNDANLIFVTNLTTYYVGENLTICTSGRLSTKEIEAGDSISGFTIPGLYHIIWKPTWVTIGSFTVSEADSTPSITFTYNNMQKRVTIVSADPGYHYSDSTSPGDANLIFVKDNITTYYVGSNLTIIISGSLSTKEIQPGDVVSGFSVGTYSVIWYPTGYVYFTFTVSEDGSTPSISLIYSGTNKRVTITAADPGYHYSDSTSSSDANLIFVKDNVTYYVGENLTICTSGRLSTKEIQAGDSISGFSAGTYSIVWYPTGVVYMTFTVSADGVTPSIGFVYDDSDKQVTIASADPGYYYSDSSSPSDANLIFVKDNATYYVGGNLTIVSSGPLSTKEIQPGDVISGFSVGTYSVIWYPTGYVYFIFTVSEAPQVEYGWIYGTVLGTMENGTFPLEDALIRVISGNMTVTSTYTDEDGNYNVSVEAGTYCVAASKDGYQSQVKLDVVIEENKGTQVGFNLSEAEWHYAGRIYGTVFGESDNTTIPLENATLAIRSIENETKNVTKLWRVTFTDQNGNYILTSIMPGLYGIKASKSGYISSTKIVEMKENQIIELNFVLQKGSIPEPPILDYENRTLIVKAIKYGHVGGEINIWHENKTYEREIMIYNNVTIPKLDIEKGRISFTISGDENSTGKTIAINIDSSVFDSNRDIIVEYDGETIKMADDINDILNPNDDGSHPEYLIAIGANGTQILVSIPHFSEHEITIFSLTPEKIVQYLEIAIVAAFVVIAIASFVMFRKGKED